ncbi:heme-binding protein [Mucilaginibacter jinjuensis]|uniref:Heme-binding protein n=1 Tax=Mucilaginibacter jinjuensis TaxID=1176721 RepID=A0ABY7TAU3_9SPHI|nr:heme-binding protein [Mucilaginibacter jinjuensis]WCT13620.1 heme-binding protein [Mucilaginibacter jinjuensis]
MESQPQELLKGFIRLGGSPEEVANKLGPLADLEGTWKGNSGWNLIAVPSRRDGDPSFTLLMQQYDETIIFTPITAPVPNRGGAVQQFVTGLMYELTITDMKYPNGILHVENGMWLNLTDIEAQPDGPVVESTLVKPFGIARMSSIPHGDVVIALGNASVSSGMPQFPVISAIPQPPGLPPVFGYTDPYTLNQFSGQFDTADVNSTLKATAAAQTVGKVTTITVDTHNKGGSISNIPFVDAHVNPSRFQSTFWIEEVSVDGVSCMQLQYSQQADLNFIKKHNLPGDILWPHVNVNTLRKI